MAVAADPDDDSAALRFGYRTVMTWSVLGVLSIGSAWRFADADARAAEENERSGGSGGGGGGGGGGADPEQLAKGKAGGEVGMPRLVSDHSAVTASGSINLSEPTI